MYWVEFSAHLLGTRVTEFTASCVVRSPLYAAYFMRTQIRESVPKLAESSSLTALEWLDDVAGICESVTALGIGGQYGFAVVDEQSGVRHSVSATVVLSLPLLNVHHIDEHVHEWFS